MVCIALLTRCQCGIVWSSWTSFELARPDIVHKRRDRNHRMRTIQRERERGSCLDWYLLPMLCWANPFTFCLVCSSSVKCCIRSWAPRRFMMFIDFAVSPTVATCSRVWEKSQIPTKAVGNWKPMSNHNMWEKGAGVSVPLFCGICFSYTYYDALTAQSHH